MIYSLEVARRTASREGLCSLFTKPGISLRQTMFGVFACGRLQARGRQANHFWQQRKNERHNRQFVHDTSQDTCAIGAIVV